MKDTTNIGLALDIELATSRRYREFLELPERPALRYIDLLRWSRKDLEEVWEKLKQEIIAGDRAKREKE